MATKPNPKAPVGQGGRFAALQQKLEQQGAKNPQAIAASVGRKKYGDKKMQQMAAIGRRMQKKNTKSNSKGK